MSGPNGHTPDPGAGVARLTDEQGRPVAVRGASVALSAGAGCGKTTVLTARFLRALDDGGPLNALVGLTFTEKAARELRQRIRGECHRRLRAGGDDAGLWRSVLRGLDAAPVSTFHEFCAGLLRRHALRAGVDPDFEVLDEALAGTILDESLARRVRRWLAGENADLVELAVEFGLRRVREGLESLVRGHTAEALADWASRTPEEVVGLWLAAWERDGRAALFRPVARAAARCGAWLEGQEFAHDKLRGLQANLLPALADVRPDLSPEALSALREAAMVPRGLRAANWPSARVNEDCKAHLQALRDAIGEFLSLGTPDEAASLRAAEQGVRFARLAAEARAAYDEAKQARGGLDFDDLLVKTLALLRDHADAVRGAAGHAVEFVLVDEFQDTDPVQAEILRHLGGEGFADGRLFVVGDFKQSIYRFRGAAPRVFQEFRDAFPEHGRHALTENFRSSAGVVDFVNALFADAFPGETPRLVPGPHSAPAADGPAVEFVWASEPEPEPADGKAAAPTVDERRRTEARWLARLVRTRLAQGWPIRDKNSKEVRKAGPKDVVFLLRAMTDLAPYEQALESEELDYHVVGGKAFYAQQEVRDLVNVLSVVEDPLDVVALAGALRGPFFGLSDEGLFWLGTAVPGGLVEGFAASGSVARLSPRDRDRADRARALLEGWRGLKDRVPIAALVDRVLDESGFEAALTGEPLGGRKRANARKLVRLARRFDARGGFTLAHFVARLRADLREPPREEQAATTEEEGESVRLMSIHQAKGLEFPIVVVPDLNRRQDIGRGGVAFGPDLGPLVRARGDDPAEGEADGGSGRSMGRVVYDARERVEEEAESVRLFYVATTRARDALILSAGAEADAKPASTAVRLLDERFDRRTGACTAALQEGWPAPRVRVTSEPPAPGPSSAPPRRVRLAPRAAARVIRSAALRDEAEGDEGAPPPPAPRLVDLDACRGLPPRAARLDRLVRSVLADPRALSTRDPRGALADAARRAARRQDPVAHPDLVAEAIELLEPWLAGPFGRDLARAEAVERGAEWTVTLPSPTGGRSTVFRGSTEFFARDSSGVWSAWTFCPPGANEAVERLRLLLSSRAAVALGFGSVTRAWRVRLGDGLRGEESFGDDALTGAVRDALAPLARG